MDRKSEKKTKFALFLKNEEITPEQPETMKSKYEKLKNC